MGWRFRHSFKVIPGVRLNLSKTGLSCSVGGAPFTLNVGPRGTYATASLPGTGIQFRQRIGGASSNQSPMPFVRPPQILPPASPPPIPDPLPAPVSLPAPTGLPVEEVHSASTELLTSASLKEIKRILQLAFEEHEDITQQLAAAQQEKIQASNRYWSWQHGFLFKRIFKGRFTQRKTILDTAEAKVAELEQQLQLTAMKTHFEIDKEQAEPFFRMRDAFAALSECTAIWDIKTHQATDRFHERTTATLRIGRDRVTFSLGSCNLLRWEDQKVPHLQNAKGGELFLFPGFILYRAAREAFSVIDFHDVTSTAGWVNFQEEETVPKDAQVVGQTWAKANKDGSPDRRFVNNYQIPIVRYASLTLKSSTGLWEEFEFSDSSRIMPFVAAWNAFVTSLGQTTN